MHRIHFRPSLLLGAALLGAVLIAGGCDSLAELDSVTVSGRVVNQNGAPLEGAVVKIVADRFVKQTEADSLGRYSFTFELSDALGNQQQTITQQQEETVATVNLSAFLGAAVSATITEQVTSGEDYTMPDLQITVSGSSGPVDTSEQAVVTGRVINQEGDPVEGATVQVKSVNMIRQDASAADGTFTFAFSAAEALGDGTASTIIPIELSAFLGADVTEGVAHEVQVGTTTTLPDLRLEVGAGAVAGPPASITLVPGSTQEIAVSGAGGMEIAQLGFVVYDADGRVVPGATVEATIDARPINVSGRTDNSFLAPNTTENGRRASNVTDAEGVAAFTLTSGTVAGTAQVVAIVPDATNPAGAPVRTQPIAVVIQSGLPNQAHFTVGVEEANKPCLNEVNCEINVVAVVGDEYSNPANEGTPVYLETNYGIVETQTFTDDLGRASGTFVTGNPFPPDGQVTLRARASGTRAGGSGTQEPIDTETRFLLTGDTQVALLSGPNLFEDFVISGDTLNPSTAFDGTPDGVRDTVIVRAEYRYRVSDRNLNPLTLGTAISVVLDGDNVESVGNDDVSIDDYVSARGPNSWTDFSFVAKMDDREEGELPYLASFEVSVSSDNGNVDWSQEAFLPLYRVEDR